MPGSVAGPTHVRINFEVMSANYSHIPMQECRIYSLKSLSTVVSTIVSLFYLSKGTIRKRVMPSPHRMPNQAMLFHQTIDDAR